MKKTLIMSFRPQWRNLLGIKRKLCIKKKVYAICIGLITLNLQLITHNSVSQNVGINVTGADPDASAGLDIDFSDKGVLIPRVALTGTGDVTTISGPTTSLLVYNTATAGTAPNNVTPGYYYWSGSEWTPFIQNGSDWTLAGNTGTINGTNFLGTTDTQDLDIRTNNVIKARITQKGQIEILNTGKSVLIGEGAGASDDLTDNRNVFIGYHAGNKTTNWGNVAIGTNALNENDTGADNVAIGEDALKGANHSQNTAVGWSALTATQTSSSTAVGYASLKANTSGERNNAVGVSALSVNISGSDNTAQGYKSLIGNTTGSNNTGVGREALWMNTTGSNNTAIGYNSNVSTGNLTNATAIGANAVVGASNTLILGGTGANSVNVGIGTTVPTNKLEVVGGRTRLNTVWIGENEPGKSRIEAESTKDMQFRIAATTERFEFHQLNNSLMIIKGTGDVGIGTVAPGYLLQVGDAGDGTEARANAWNNLSDRRLKTNIIPISNALEKVEKLEGVYFDWKSTGEKSVGFIAQEVEKILPEIISKGKTDDYLAMQYGNVTAVLVEAIKEQQRIIEDQRKDIVSLEARLEQESKNTEMRLKQVEEHLKTANK